MTDEQWVFTFWKTIVLQLRSAGVVLHDDAGNRIRPGSPEEDLIVRTIARNLAQHVTNDLDRQTPPVGSST